MVRLLLVLFALVVGVSGAGFLFGTLNKETESQTPPATEPATFSSPMNTTQTWADCVNSVKGFSLKYPFEWTSGTESHPCSLFSLSGNPPILVNTNLKIEDFTTLKTSLGTSDETRLILTKRQIEVDGESAEMIETEATGIGTEIKGTRTVYYLFERPSLPVAISYTDNASNTDREENLKTLEQMVASFDFVAN